MLPAKWREGTRKLNVIKNIASVFGLYSHYFAGSQSLLLTLQVS